ncbi:MAG: TraR/DksA family transcriptional regulator [Pseudobdellovibrio sp.]
MNSTESNSIQNELLHIKKSLLEQKSEILNKSLEFKNQHQATETKAADEADAVVQNLQDNLDIQLHERDRHSLLLIDRALSKFANDTYGICDSCGDVISLKRLKARPLATRCVACEEELETSGRDLIQ